MVVRTSKPVSIVAAVWTILGLLQCLVPSVLSFAELIVSTEMVFVEIVIFTARAYARAVLGVAILSVRLSVCLSHAWIVTKLNDALQIFLYRTKGQSLCYSDTNSGWWATRHVAMARKVTLQSMIASNWPRTWNRWSSSRLLSAIAELLVLTAFCIPSRICPSLDSFASCILLGMARKMLGGPCNWCHGYCYINMNNWQLFQILAQN